MSGESLKFEFSPENFDRAKAHIAKYPEDRQASAVLPLQWVGVNLSMCRFFSSISSAKNCLVYPWLTFPLAVWLSLPIWAYVS